MLPLYEVHLKRVQAWMRGERNSFVLTDTCRLDNGNVKILPKEISQESTNFKNFATLVLAAGAASRYVNPFSAIISAIQDRNCHALKQAFKEFKKGEYAKSLLPEFLIKAMSDVEKADKSQNVVSWSELQALENLPKALFPCVAEGLTFLQEKILEHKKYGDFFRQYFIVSDGMQKQFESLTPDENQVFYLEQNGPLATLRFDKNHQIVNNHLDQPAFVAGGHGSIAALFPQLKNNGVENVFIRNIDNLSGWSEEVLSATRHFLNFHSWMVGEIKKLRIELGQENLSAAGNIAGTILKMLGEIPCASAFENLKILAYSVFSQEISQNDTSEFAALFAKPYVTMGQVPNLGNDVGGSPALVEVNGKKIRLCIEGPHVTETDRKKFLENPKLSTHFNPGFTAVEMQEEFNEMVLSDHPYWLVAQKKFLGTDVWYHEAILYEMLSSSDKALCLFVEIPRATFKPNKSLLDTIGRSLEDLAKR